MVASGRRRVCSVSFARSPIAGSSARIRSRYWSSFVMGPSFLGNEAVHLGEQQRSQEREHAREIRRLGVDVVRQETPVREGQGEGGELGGHAAGTRRAEWGAD